MCDCISQTTHSLTDKLISKVETKVKVNEWIDKGTYQNRSFSMKGGPTRIGMSFVIQYRIEKTNGEPAKNITTENITIYPSFCPFCGEKYPEEV